MIGRTATNETRKKKKKKKQIETILVLAWAGICVPFLGNAIMATEGGGS